MASVETDEQLMRQLSHGSGSAMAELMRRYEGPIRGLIERMCRRLDATDDIFQDVWARVYVYRHKFNPRTRRTSGKGSCRKSAFGAYLFTIAVNCCRNAISRASRRRVLSLDASGDDDSPTPQLADGRPPAGGLDALIHKERRGELHDAVDDLPPAERAVVLLYMLFDTDYGRIATVLGKSPGTVRSQMHHALRHLREALTRISLNKPAPEADSPPLENEAAHGR